MSTPRYSIIPGDFATDMRADVGHFRVLNLIGRHTDAAGWCRLKQLVIGDAVGLSRETVNRKIADLVAWGYVEKHAEDATGRAIWYRTIMDRPQRPPPTADDDTEACDDGPPQPSGHVTRASQVGTEPVENGAGLHTTCDAALTPGVTHGITPGVTPAITHNDPSLTTKSPLPHRASPTGNSEPMQREKAEALCQAAEAAGAPHQVVAHLLRPVLTQRRFSAAGDKVAELVALARSARDLPEPALAAAARLLLAADVATLKPERIRRAIAAAKVGGAMVTVRKGSAQWQRWVEHLAVIDPGQAAAMARFETWLVRSEWPGSAPAGTRGLQDGETSPPASASGRLAERESDAPARRAAP